MNAPAVSFVVPCYNLAHFLPECVNSILSQSFSDLEVLIMDDCSPDNTKEVAMSFLDSRVKYIRNDRNLGHLANYNKGIEQSLGRYVWLISADDRLRRPYVLERYVLLMDQNPQVGFVCCPAMGLQDGVETNLVWEGRFGSSDKIFDGRQFISTSLDKGYGLISPSVMVRKNCYDEISLFPLDMPHQGDLYLWYRWALDYDVAYMCEPMVNYRYHDKNIMKELFSHDDTVFKDGNNVLWRTKNHCEQKGLSVLADKIENFLSWRYANVASTAVYGDNNYCFLKNGMSIAECDQSLRDSCSSDLEYKRLRGLFFTAMGNQHWQHKAFKCARQSYFLALRDNWRMPQVWLKIFILVVGLGGASLFIKKLISDFKAEGSEFKRLLADNDR